MICDKCGGSVGTSGKCYSCGYDNSQVDYTPVSVEKMRTRSAGRLKVFSVILMVVGGLLFWGSCVAMVKLFSPGIQVTDEVILMRVLLGMTAILSLGQMLLFFFIYRMKKWAAIAYFVSIGASAVMRMGRTLLSFDRTLIVKEAIGTLLGIALIVWVFKRDWEWFE